jgi:hypothetical protein
VTDEEREAHISAVVDSAPLPPAEDIDRLRALLQMHARPAIEPATARTRPAQPTAA